MTSEWGYSVFVCSWRSSTRSSLKLKVTVKRLPKLWNRYNCCDKKKHTRTPYRPLCEEPETTVFQERQNKARLQYSRVVEGKNCEAQILISASNFAHCFHILTVYWACSICMNPRAGLEWKNFAMVFTIHELRILFVARSCKIVVLSRLTCLLRNVYLPGPKTKTFRP